MYTYFPWCPVPPYWLPQPPEKSASTPTAVLVKRPYLQYLLVIIPGNIVYNLQDPGQNENEGPWVQKSLRSSRLQQQSIKASTGSQAWGPVWLHNLHTHEAGPDSRGPWIVHPSASDMGPSHFKLEQLSGRYTDSYSSAVFSSPHGHEETSKTRLTGTTRLRKCRGVFSSPRSLWPNQYVLSTAAAPGLHETHVRKSPATIPKTKYMTLCFLLLPPAMLDSDLSTTTSTPPHLHDPSQGPGNISSPWNLCLCHLPRPLAALSSSGGLSSSPPHLGGTALITHPLAFLHCASDFWILSLIYEESFLGEGRRIPPSLSLALPQYQACLKTIILLWNFYY